MDDLDNAIEQTLKANDAARMGSSAAADPLDAAVGRVIDLDKSRQRATLQTAAKVNPDQAAQANTLAAKRGLPQDVVLRNLPQVQQQQAAEEADVFLASSPALAGKMRDLPFAQVAHDDVASLAGIENHLRTTAEFRALKGPEPTLGSYLSGVWESVKGGAKMADLGLSMQVGDLAAKLGFESDPVRRAELIRRYEQASAQVRTATPEFETDTARGIYGGASSLARQIPGTTLSILTRSPTPALMAMGVQTEAEAYSKYTARGATPGQALLGAAGEGAVEVLTEKIPMGFIVDKFGKQGAKQFLAGMLVREVPSEQVATLLQDAIDTAIANPEKTWGEYWQERPSAAYQTLLATLVQSGAMGGASYTVERIAARAERQQQQAEQDGKTLTDLLVMAEKDKLRERDPSSFASMVQAAAEQHQAPTEVYINANALVETLAQSGMTTEQIAAALPSAGSQIVEAVAAGGDVVVPIGEFTALAAGSGFEQQLVKHARLDPEALSQEDAKLLAKVDLKAETEKALQAADKELEKQATSVRSQVVAQLNDAGRFSPAVNDAYADSVSAFYETTAARMGMTPEELWAAYPLNIRAEITPGAALDQGGFRLIESETWDDGRVIEFGEVPFPQLDRRVESPTGVETRSAIETTVALSDLRATQKRITRQGVEGPRDDSYGLPLVVHSNGVLYIQDGHHRLTAQKFAGDREARVRLVDLDARQGRAPYAAQSLNQQTDGTRGQFTPSTNTITLLARADLSTFLHETGHFYLEVLADLASKPDAPPAIAEDMKAVLKWFGYEGTASDWLKQSVDQRRDNHEKFARGFEAHLLEGKAPSVELSRIFARFRSWLVSIYRSVRALNVELNDDIRQVFDRLLASDEAIKEAEAVRAYAPLFADEKAIKEAGVDQTAYQALGAEATEAAVEALTARSMRDMRWLSNAKSRALKALQAEAKTRRATIEAQVTAEVDAKPVYRAKSELKAGGEPGAVADALGFSSVEQMQAEIKAAEPRKEVIKGLTDQRMLEEHGELASPDALERAAEEAIRNDARGRFIATELAALDKAIGPARVLVKAAKDFAQAIIGRKTLKEIKPHIFAAAETRNAKLAQKMLGKSTEEAATAKRNQLLNHYAARYAHDAQNEIERIRQFFGRVANTPDDRLKSRDIDVVNAARVILSAYGIGRKGEAAADYLKRVAAYDPDMSQVLQSTVDAAMQNAKPLDELTFDELRALNDEIASLWHLAKRSRQMEIDGNLLDREEVQGELVARLEEIGIPETMPGEGSAITPTETRLAKLKTYLASARRTESWVEAMDGKPTGGFRRFIWQPVKEAADAYRADKAKLLKKYRALLDNIAPTLKKEVIEAPELGYTFGKDTGGVAMNEILHAIAHTGNESNKRKLLLGRKWATELEDGTLDTRRWDAFVRRLANEGKLEKRHFDFVQGLWDLLEETKPLAQQTHRDVFGKYFAEVTADTLDTPFGQYRGGYVPAQADPRVVSDAQTRALMEAENDSMAYAFPTTNRGFTKGRVEYNRPLMLDLSTIAQHIDKVLLFGHLERPIRDVRRVLTSKDVAYGVNRIDPAAFDSIISPWLNRAARQQVTTPSPGHWQSWRLWSTLRNRAGMAAMFGNVVNAAQQITGFSIAAVKVPPKYLLGAMAQYVRSPREVSQTVAEASSYMEGRMRNEVSAMNDAIKDILINPGLYERAQQWTMHHAYFMQSAVDNVMSPVIWTGAYNQALEQGQTEKDAIRHADSVVRTTQGSTLPEDISNWESGSSFSRMFSQFAGYFNMQANLLGTEFQIVARDMGLRKGAGRGLYVLALAFLVPAWVSELIVQAAKGGPDDEDKDGEYLDDWLAAVFGFSTLRGAAAMVPIFGQAASAAVNAMNDKPYDDRIATSPAVSMIEAAFKAPWDVYKAMFEDGDKSKAVKDVASLISLTTGIPANIAARPLSYMADVQEGDVVPTSPADAARGAITGRASPDSKR